MARKFKTWPLATGKNLDKIGSDFGLNRNKYFFLFKESDKKYLKRLNNFTSRQFQREYSH